MQTWTQAQAIQLFYDKKHKRWKIVECGRIPTQLMAGGHSTAVYREPGKRCTPKNIQRYKSVRTHKSPGVKMKLNLFEIQEKIDSLDTDRQLH